MTNVEESDLNAKMFAAALNSPVPRVYLNGFLLGQSFSDITVVGQTNGNPSTVLNMSFTTAKSLAIELDKIIKKFEETTGHTLLTMEDIGTKMGNYHLDSARFLMYGSYQDDRSRSWQMSYKIKLSTMKLKLVNGSKATFGRMALFAGIVVQ